MERMVLHLASIPTINTSAVVLSRCYQRGKRHVHAFRAIQPQASEDERVSAE